MPAVKLSQRYVDGLKPTEKLVLTFDTSLTGFGVYSCAGSPVGNERRYAFRILGGFKAVTCHHIGYVMSVLDNAIRIEVVKHVADESGEADLRKCNYHTDTPVKYA